MAADVTRLLTRSPDKLERTDVADHALAALRESRVREVVVLGRRGPAQAAFTSAELRELGHMEGSNSGSIRRRDARSAVTAMAGRAGHLHRV